MAISQSFSLPCNMHFYLTCTHLPDEPKKVGASKDAVMTQVWIAVCVCLLLAFIKFQSKISKSMQHILRLLQRTLFAKRDLMALLRGEPTIDKSTNNNQMTLM